jgi:hypothetical protein
MSAGHSAIPKIRCRCLNDRARGSERKNATSMMSNNDLFACGRVPQPAMDPGSSDLNKAVPAKVPRSPNRHFDKLRMHGKFDVARRKVKLYGLADVRSGLRLGFASRGAAGEFGTHRREVTGLGIAFQNDSERHIHSILLRPRWWERSAPTDAVTAVTARPSIPRAFLLEGPACSSPRPRSYGTSLAHLPWARS